MATFGGTATDIHSNETFNNGFYNPDVYGNFHFQQNNDCAQEPRQNFQNFPVPLSPPLPHPHPHASYPFPGPYSGYESGLAPSCPQLVEEKLLSNDEHLPAARTQDDLHAYPAYPHRFAEPRNSSLLPAPVLPLRFSASRKNFPPDSEQQSSSPSNSNNNNNNNNSNNNINNINNNSNNNNNNINTNNNNSSFQIQYPVPSFPGVPGQYGYGPQYMPMPHLYARPPPLSPYHQHPTGWTTPLPPHQHQNQATTATTTTTEGPYLQNNHQSLLKVSPSMYYSQDFAASHPNAAPVRFRASVEYPETSGWNRKEDGEGQEEEEEAKEEEKERKIQRKIPANNARKIVYGLDPLPRQMIMQASSSSAAAATDYQEQPKTTNAIVPVPNGTQYAPVPNGTQYAPVPNGTQYAPVPNGTQYAPVPNGTQYAPVPNGTQYAPVPNGTQYASVPNGTQYMPVPYGTPYIPAPDGTPYMSVPNGTPYMPVPNGAPYMPVPNGSQYAPVPYGAPYMPVPNGTPCLPRNQEPRLETINENGPVTRQQGQEPPDGRAVTNASGSSAGEAVKGTNPESEKALDEGPKIDFTPAKVVSCLVIVFCGGLLWGVLGFIFAVEGQTRYLKGDRKKALKLKGLSYLMSIVGIVCGMLAAIIVGVLFGVYRT